MRRMLASVLLPLAAAAPLAAQQFEGTVNMKMTGTGPAAEGMMMRVAIKGDQQVTIITLPANAGPMAGQEVRAIMDPKTQTVTTLMPMPPGMGAMAGMPDAKGMKMIVDLSKVRSDASTSAGFTPAPSSRAGVEVMSVPTTTRSPDAMRSTGFAAAS